LHPFLNSFIKARYPGKLLDGDPCRFADRPDPRAVAAIALFLTLWFALFTAQRLIKLYGPG
jgi:hypothetical protein